MVENIENFISTFQKQKFCQFHDQEFFVTFFNLKLNKGDIKSTRERNIFLSAPHIENFWKRQVVHYSHNFCEQYLTKYNINFNDEARCRIIEEHFT